jgi:hypothetical protein
MPERSKDWINQAESFVVEESLNSVKVFWLEQEQLVEEIYNPIIQEAVKKGITVFER